MISTAEAVAQVQDTATAFYAGKVNRNTACSALIDTIVGRIGCTRVSLWRFDGPPDALTLLCVASKAAGGELVLTERRLRQAEYAEYFNGLIATGMYVADDAMTDPHLQPMHDNYLLPNQVHSMLDAAFLVNGRGYGTVCCEQTDAIRRWRADEIAALRAIVGKLALLMAGAGDDALWDSPSLPLVPISNPPAAR